MLKGLAALNPKPQWLLHQTPSSSYLHMQLGCYQASQSHRSLVSTPAQESVCLKGTARSMRCEFHARSSMLMQGVRFCLIEPPPAQLLKTHSILNCSVFGELEVVEPLTPTIKASFIRYNMPFELPSGPRPVPKYTTTSLLSRSADESTLCFMAQQVIYNPAISTMSNTLFAFPPWDCSRDCRSATLPFIVNLNGELSLLRNNRNDDMQQSAGGILKAAEVRFADVGAASNFTRVPPSADVFQSTSTYECV